MVSLSLYLWILDLYLGIIWELHGEAGGEVGHDGVGLIKPDAQHREAERADDRREKAAPVVADSEVDAGDLQIRVRYLNMITRYIQSVLITSMLKRTPPMGLAKQHATPTATAAASISLLRDSLA